jgi:hypothetical protein
LASIAATVCRQASPRRRLIDIAFESRDEAATKLTGDEGDGRGSTCTGAE